MHLGGDLRGSVELADPSGRARDITELLQAWSDDDAASEEELFRTVYGELSRIASGQLRGERSNHTLEPRALVHDTYLRLLPQRHVDWRNRAHFFAIATKTMRRVLLDYAKQRRRGKRGGGAVQVFLQIEAEPEVRRDTVLENLNEALRGLATENPRLAGVTELRFFGGLSVREVAAVLRLSERTVARDWLLAKAWLVRELTRD